MTYTAAIVGCGNIGALKPDDRDYPGGENVLTHAHAYSDHERVRLVGAVDPDEGRLNATVGKWPLDMAFSEVVDMGADIISVCTPTAKHFSAMKEILGLQQKPRLVICEKPFCSSLAEATTISRLYAEQGIAIMVDYSRRFSKNYQDFAEVIRQGLVGEIYHARLMYGRGLKRDGCHGIDLFNWILGECHEIIVNKLVFDFLKDDPTVNIGMRYSLCENVQMVGVSSNAYGVFEMDFVTSSGRYVFAEYGKQLQVFAPRTEPIYRPCPSLPGLPTASEDTDLTKTLTRMVDNAVAFLDGDQQLLCGAEEGVKVHRVIATVEKSINERRN